LRRRVNPDRASVPEWSRPRDGRRPPDHAWRAVRAVRPDLDGNADESTQAEEERASDAVRARRLGARGLSTGPVLARPRDEALFAEACTFETAKLSRSGRIAQRESARFTRERSLVRSQVRPSGEALETALFRFAGDAARLLPVAAWKGSGRRRARLPEAFATSTPTEEPLASRRGTSDTDGRRR
jgi:hypothetical protein